jgi:tRNA(fMet)-specific endonuclease VapC
VRRYLLDTNTLSDLIRNPQGKVAIKITRVGTDAICTSIIVAAELRFGAAKSGSEKLQARVELILSAIDVLSLEAPVDVHYAELRLYLTRLGTPIGPNDLLIAAHARALDLAIATANLSEFSRVTGLRVENWLS